MKAVLSESTCDNDVSKGINSVNVTITDIDNSESGCYKWKWQKYKEQWFKQSKCQLYQNDIRCQLS